MSRKEGVPARSHAISRDCEGLVGIEGERGFTDLDVTCTTVEVEMEVLHGSVVGKLVLHVFLGRFFV